MQFEIDKLKLTVKYQEPAIDGDESIKQPISDDASFLAATESFMNWLGDHDKILQELLSTQTDITNNISLQLHFACLHSTFCVFKYSRINELLRYCFEAMRNDPLTKELHEIWKQGERFK